VTPAYESTEPVELDRSALMQTYAEPPVTFVRGEGTLLWDTEGRRYLDFLSGLAVTSLGHAHRAVADALNAQALTLLHTSNLFGNVVAPEPGSLSLLALGMSGLLFVLYRRRLLPSL
jgi:acetylornithine/succinyldiaminopimelate/putrescine aminotransferase